MKKEYLDFMYEKLHELKRESEKNRTQKQSPYEAETADIDSAVHDTRLNEINNQYNWLDRCISIYIAKHSN